MYKAWEQGCAMTLVIESVFTLCIRNPELQAPLYSIYIAGEYTWTYSFNFNSQV